MDEKQKYKDIAKGFRDIADLFDVMAECEDENKLEEYAALYFVKMMKIQNNINGM